VFNMAYVPPHRRQQGSSPALYYKPLLLSKNVSFFDTWLVSNSEDIIRNHSQKYQEFLSESEKNADGVQLNGIPFQISRDGNGNDIFAGEGKVVIPLEEAIEASSVHLIVNCVWGKKNEVIGRVTFVPETADVACTNATSPISVELKVGINVRDHILGGFCNTVKNGESVLRLPGKYDDNLNSKYSLRLDSVRFDLPRSFKLKEIVFENFGLGEPQGDALLW